MLWVDESQKKASADRQKAGEHRQRTHPGQMCIRDSVTTASRSSRDTGSSVNARTERLSRMFSMTALLFMAFPSFLKPSDQAALALEARDGLSISPSPPNDEAAGKGRNAEQPWPR